MKKKLIVGASLIAVTGVLLAGCGQQDPIYFEGKLMDVQNVEEILGDRIEDENGKEYILNISEDTED